MLHVKKKFILQYYIYPADIVDQNYVSEMLTVSCIVKPL